MDWWGHAGGRRVKGNWQITDFSPAPVLLCFPLHGWRVRVLELEPILGPTAAIDRAQPLRHDAFKPHLAGVTEDRVTGMRQMLIELNARATAAKDT
jgi:hypothetical protein